MWLVDEELRKEELLASVLKDGSDIVGPGFG